MDVDAIQISLPPQANLQLPDPALLHYYNDLSRRDYWIDDEITTELDELINLIYNWNCEDRDIPVEDRKPIKLFFFSPGGDLETSWAVIDAITASTTPIIGINVGECASGAAFMYLACHKRYTTPHGYFLFHQGQGVISGTYAQICAQLDDYQDQIEELGTFVLEHTSYSAEEIADKIVNEWYVRTDEALQYGVAEKVINKWDDLL